MQFIPGNNRHQTFFSTLEEQVAADNAVRHIDAFVDKLDLAKLGFTNMVYKSEGRQKTNGRPTIRQKLLSCAEIISQFFSRFKMNIKTTMT